MGGVEMSDNSRMINRVFTKNVFSDLLSNGSNEVFENVVRKYVLDPYNKSYGQLVNEIYNYLSKDQRNEYYYINTLLNKLLVGIHNVNTTTAFTQLRICSHIADFVMINGEGRVYEIKTDLDNLDRLHSQLSDYFKAFSKVSVLVSESNAVKVRKTLTDLGEMGNAVGIYCLNKHDIIFSKKSTREPKCYENALEHASLFKLLRKQEYENVLMRYFGEVPIVPPVFVFKESLAMFKMIPVLEAQKLVFAELKKRTRIKKEVFEKIQKELKSVVYFSDLYKSSNELERFLESIYRR